MMRPHPSRCIPECPGGRPAQEAVLYAPEGIRVRVVVEASEVMDAWQWNSGVGRGLGLAVTTSDGRRRNINLDQPGPRIERIEDEEIA
jgi:hypothetical protein